MELPLGLLFVLVAYAGAQIVPEPKLEDATPEMERIQHLSLNLLMKRNLRPVELNLEEELDKFEKPESVHDFMSFYKKGLLGKNERFIMRNPTTKEETIAVVDLLFSAKEFDTLYKVAMWLSDQMNYEQYVYSLAIVLVHRPDIHIVLPAWYNIFTNYFVEMHVMAHINQSATQNTPNTMRFWAELNNGPYYLTFDPSLANMYYNWNLYFPTWMDPKKYGHQEWDGRGKLFYRYHHQLLSAFLLAASDSENVTSKIQHWNGLPLEFAFDLLNSYGQQVQGRSEGARYVESNALKEMERKLLDVAREKKIVTPSGVPKDLDELKGAKYSSVASLAFNLTDSLNPNYYGNYYEALIDFLARTGVNAEDGGTFVDYPLAMVKDPSFYTLLFKVTSPLLNLLKEEPRPKLVPVPGLMIKSIEADKVESWYEPFTIDAGRHLGRRYGKFLVNQIVLSHSQLNANIVMENAGTEPKDALITMFLPTADGLFDLELDRFLVKVPPGEHNFKWNLKNSSIMASEDEWAIKCGIPYRLALPKGIPDGLTLVLAARMEPTVDLQEAEMEEEKFQRISSLCGGRRYENGGRSLLGPGPQLDEAIVSGIAAKDNLVIHHKVNKWSWKYSA